MKENKVGNHRMEILLIGNLNDLIILHSKLTSEAEEQMKIIRSILTYLFENNISGLTYAGMNISVMET